MPQLPKGLEQCFFADNTINQVYLGLAGFFFSAFLSDLSDVVAQYSKVAQTVGVLSQSEHSLDSGKNFPLRYDRKRSGFCGCSRLPFTARVQIRCNFSSSVKWEKHIQFDFHGLQP